jgi:arylsulfatase
MDNDNSRDGTSRRDFLRAAGVGAAALGFGVNAKAAAATGAPRSASGAATGPFNILFILVDQERHFREGELPLGFRLPAHERLMKQGTTFANHRINSCVCTPSRSVVYTGQHIQHTKMFDNTNFPWITSMSTEIPTVGDMLRDAGYYTAYKGKWHLTKEFETVNKLGTPTKIFTQEMEAYGFSDYFGIGDIIAHTQGGYLHDGVIANLGLSWLRGKGRELAAQGKPWFMAVNLVNPHDVMFYDTDAPGTAVQAQRGITHVARDPVDPLYAKQWSFKLPASHFQPLDARGRPPAHRDFLRSHDALVGHIPNEEARWRRRHNYYLNCIRDVDRNVAAILAELDAAGLADKTIVIFTADHGDMDGAHQLHAKGAVAYREQNNVPLIVVHPAYAGGKQCKAITSHVDLAPTMLGFTGLLAVDKRAAIVGKLPGKDFASLLATPERADLNTLHEAVLFNYNMFAYLDGEFLEKAVEFMQKGGNPSEIRSAGIRPDMMKRGAVRSMYDGRYVFTRYFSPKEHNRPATLEDLYRVNDVELFDVKSDPDELTDLAADRSHRDLVEAMNEKLNRLIDTEVGEDRGQMLPGGIEAGWEVSAETMAGA